MAIRATASQLPWRDSDGYTYGGEAVLTIGDRSLIIGSGKDALALAQEVAKRWNAKEEDEPVGTPE